MSDRISYVRLFFDDFEGGIVQLTSHERGVYFTLCLRYWATKRCLYDDDRTLARACNCSVQAYRKTKAKLIELGKIAVVDGKVYQPRADSEYEDALKDWEKYKRWKRQKDRKKIDKKSDLVPEKSSEISEGDPNPEPKGSGTPKGVIQNLPHECALALDGLRASAVTEHAVNEVESLAGCVTGWEDQTLFVTGKYALDRFTESLARELRAERIKLAIGKPKPKLTAIEGGKS